MAEKRKEKRIHLIREISGIFDDFTDLTSPLACQFIAFVSGSNAFGDLGGLSRNFPDPVKSFELFSGSEIVSVNYEGGETRRYTEPIRSLKGGGRSYLGGLGVLLADGTFLAGGGSSYGREGRGRLVSFECLAGTKIKKISAGYDHFLLLSDDGKVFSMLSRGKYSKNKGQLGTGDIGDHYEPVEIDGIPKIRKIRAGLHSSALIDEENGLWICGSGCCDGKYFPFQNAFEKPTKIASDVRNVFLGFYSKTTFVQDVDGHVLAGGSNWAGQCGTGFTTKKPWNLSEWSEIVFEDGDPLEQGELAKISCSGGASFILLADGTLFSCGHGSENGFGMQKTKFARVKTLDGRVLDFVCGESLSVFLTDSGRVYVAGGTDSPNISGEYFLEIAWRNEIDREGLCEMVEEGVKFKISVWQGIGLDIFITEQADKRVLAERLPECREFLEAELDEKMDELANDIIYGETGRAFSVTWDAKGDTKSLANETSEGFILLKAFNAFLAPLNSLDELERFLHFFEFTESTGRENILELYKKTSPRTLRMLRATTSSDQRAAVEKITEILKVYGLLRVCPSTKKRFAFSARAVRFELFDQVYNSFHECLSLANDSTPSPKFFSILDTIFRYFGVLDFDLDSLISFVSSLSDSLNDELEVVRTRLSRGTAQSADKVLETSPDTGEQKDAVQEYLKFLDVTFFEKFSFLVLRVITEFLSSFTTELTEQKTQDLLRESILKVSEQHWNELKTREAKRKGDESDGDDQSKLLKSLKTIYDEMVAVDEKMQKSKDRKELKQYQTRSNELQSNLQSSLIAFLRQNIGDKNVGDGVILRELLTVFRSIGVIEGEPAKSERVVEILESDFDLEIDTVRMELSRSTQEPHLEFSVIGFKNSTMEKVEFFYDPAGNLNEKYSEVPKIEGYSGHPLTILIEFYTDERIRLEDVQIKLVHLFSGETITLDGAPNEGRRSPLKSLRRRNAFQITVPDLKYSGEFALVVTLLRGSSGGGVRRFFHRKIFNVHPQGASLNDF